MDYIVPLFVVFPLAAAFLISILGRFVKGFSKVTACCIFFALLILSFFYVFSGNHAPIVYKIGGWEPINNIPIAIYLILDPFSGFMLCIINTMAFLSALYAISYITMYTGENYFYTLLCIMVAGLNGVVITGDLFNLYVFLEITVIASYALVAFGTEKEELEASFKYQVLGGIATTLILFSIGMIYWYTKTLNIPDIARILNGSHDGNIIRFCELMLIAGFGLKAAIMPFHGWLPDAHSSAPSPISAMLSGVVIKAAGLYVIFRLFFNMFQITWDIAVLITAIGTLSMVVGVFLAIGQWDLKRLLAYHSISQMGYVIIGIGMGMMILANNGNRSFASLAIMGGLFHLVNHAVFKGLLFLNAGAIEFRLGTRDLNKMGGLFEKMPVTSATSLTASMAISGIPPFNGFFSKLVIIIAAVLAKFYLLAALAVIVSIITLASFLKFQRYAFFNRKSNNKTRNNLRDVPFLMIFSMVVLAVLCLALSLLLIPGIRGAILQPAVDVLMEKNGYFINLLKL
jgi:multicomponent Na+:H+ antiporter subunit D